MSLEEIKCIKVNGVVMLMSLVLFGAWELPRSTCQSSMDVQ